METKPTEAGRHGWRSACAPDDQDKAYATFATFSISFFKWVPKAKGGVKKGKTFLRMTSHIKNSRAALAHADAVLKQLDEGWVPRTKTALFPG